LKNGIKIYFMNEFLSSDPTCCRSSIEFKALLDLFGPLTGRYHLSCPYEWISAVSSEIEEWGDIDRSRAKVTLRRAIERGAFIRRASITWDESISWLKNIELILTEHPKLLQYVIVDREREDSSKLSNAYSLEELILSPTSEEKIDAIPGEFVRVSKCLLNYFPELIFVDPYLNPCNKYVGPVLNAIMSEVKGKRCEKIKIWVRDKTLRDAGNDCKMVRNKIRYFAEKCDLEGMRLEYITVDDQRKKDRMHGRYLFGLKGGVRFDQGFQQLQKGVKMDVSPVSSSILDSLITKFIEEKNDLRVINRICIEV